MPQEISSGIVVYHKDNNEVKYLILHYEAGHWDFPKGHIEGNEKLEEAAIRETKEEIGVVATLVSRQPIHKEQYFFYADYKKSKKEKREKVFKTVSFYLAEYQSGDPKDHGWEMEDAGWYSFDKALELMAFKGEKQALEKAKKKINKLSCQASLFT